MITVTEYKNQKVAVFGLGKAGEAAIASLLAGGAIVYAGDDKPISGDQWQSAIQSGQLAITPYSAWPWDDIKALVLSPGVPLTHPKPHAVVETAHKFSCPVIGDIELLYRACPNARYVAITGTNGKSTTTTLIGHILQSAGVKTEIGGNLGTAALSLNPLGADGTYVLELSSYQLDLLKTTRFNVAAFLNITPDHLDRHGSMEGYITAKMHIFDRQKSEDTAVIAVDDDYTRSISDWGLGEGGRKWVQISSYCELTSGIYVKDGILHDSTTPDVAINLIPIPTLTGRHNWQNAAIAYAVARACGIKPGVIAAAMQSFAGLRHRMQLAATINGVRFINDSKATNADATSNALAPYDTIYWIAGGKPKAGGIATLSPYFSHITHAFLIGEAEDDFAKTLEGQVPYTRCKTLDVAVKKAADMAFTSPSPLMGEGGVGVNRTLTSSQAPPYLTPQGTGNQGPVVLLSPACASFDQFKSFEQRGDVFCELVADLETAHAL